MKLIPLLMGAMAGCYLAIGTIEIIVHKDGIMMLLGLVPLVCWLAMMDDMSSNKTDRQRRPWLYHKWRMIK